MKNVGRLLVALIAAMAALFVGSGTSHAGLDNELSLVDGKGRTLNIQQWDTFLNGVFPLDRNRLTREWFHSGKAVYSVTGDGADDFAGLVNYADAYQVGARRFDVGEKCTPTLLGLIAALRQLQAWGVPRIAASLAAVNARIAAPLQALGAGLLPPRQRSPHILGVSLPDGRAGPVLAALRAQEVHISQRGASLRFAPHLHVDDHDEQRLLQALRTALA